MPREPLLTMTEAAAWLEKATGVRRSPGTVWSWVYYGRRGVLLEAMSVAGRWHTTGAALRRFLSACTRAHGADRGLAVNELELTG